MKEVMNKVKSNTTAQREELNQDASVDPRVIRAEADEILATQKIFSQFEEVHQVDQR